jgi:hypothetical protein
MQPKKQNHQNSINKSQIPEITNLNDFQGSQLS